MEQLLNIAIFLGFGAGFVLVNLLVGKLVRPSLPNPDKVAIYECGEPTIGSSWVQFDLRFYIVALFYLVFDVEVALIYPWAVVFRDFPTEAIVLGAPFLGLIVIGYAYEWYSGSLDWVRSAVTVAVKGSPGMGPAVMGPPGTAVARGRDLASLARRDPNALEDEAVAAQER